MLGRIVHLLPIGRRPNRIVGRLARFIDTYASTHGGEAFTQTMAFVVPELPSGRETFSPDASYYNGLFPANDMAFIEGPPTFAAEVRSENDYGDAAEADLAAKRDDYFLAGTLVVWDVDPVAQRITRYRPNHAPVVFTQGQIADAEPALPGWQVPVADVFA